jgi:hypothetical protein
MLKPLGIALLLYAAAEAMKKKNTPTAPPQVPTVDPVPPNRVILPRGPVVFPEEGETEPVVKPPPAAPRWAIVTPKPSVDLDVDSRSFENRVDVVRTAAQAAQRPAPDPAARIPVVNPKATGPKVSPTAVENRRVDNLRTDVRSSGVKKPTYRGPLV